MALERDESHRYWYTDDQGRRELLGVTRTLIEGNLVDDEYFTDRARGRGKLVHLFAEMILTNTLDRPVDQSVIGPLIGLRKFLDMYAPTIHGAEAMLAHVVRLLAGQIDLDVSILGGPAVIEIKLSQPSIWHGLQLAPYAFLLDGTKWMSRARFGLYLNDRGGFRLKEYDEQSDLDYFFRAFELLHWRVRHATFERPFGRKPVDTVSDLSVDRYALAGDHVPVDDDGDWRDGFNGDLPGEL
jgi:hypothetical protein